MIGDPSDYEMRAVRRFRIDCGEEETPLRCRDIVRAELNGTRLPILIQSLGMIWGIDQHGSATRLNSGPASDLPMQRGYMDTFYWVELNA